MRPLIEAVRRARLVPRMVHRSEDAGEAWLSSGSVRFSSARKTMDPGLDSATEQSLPHTAVRGVQTGTVTSGDQDADP